jgi:hypothetical protein
MKRVEVKIHIGNRSNQKGEGSVHIEISDVKSGVRIIDVDMSLSEYGELVAGNGFNSGVAECCDNFDVLGKKKESKSVFMPKDIISNFSYDDKENKDIAIGMWCEDNGFIVDGWDVWDNGLRSQQNGVDHKINLFRYVDAL